MGDIVLGAASFMLVFALFSAGIVFFLVRSNASECCDHDFSSLVEEKD